MFAYTETDAADLTYFLLNQLSVLGQATDELLSHLRERASVSMKSHELCRRPMQSIIDSKRCFLISSGTPTQALRWLATQKAMEFRNLGEGSAGILSAKFRREETHWKVGLLPTHRTFPGRTHEEITFSRRGSSNPHPTR